MLSQGAASPSVIDTVNLVHAPCRMNASARCTGSPEPDCCGWLYMVHLRKRIAGVCIPRCKGSELALTRAVQACRAG